MSNKRKRSNLFSKTTDERLEIINEKSKKNGGLSNISNYSSNAVESESLKNIINDVMCSTQNIIKHGYLNEKVLLELKMNTSLYNYIEVIVNYYDDKDRPSFNNCSDVEGMGYNKTAESSLLQVRDG